MARNSLPESLELLLDTMCNTFGGVMFIAISMVVTLMISQQAASPEKQRDAERKQLEALREECRELTERMGKQKERLDAIRKMTEAEGKNTETALPQSVIDMEQELRDASDEEAQIRNRNADAKAEVDKLTRKNSDMETNLERQARDYPQKKQKIDAENIRLNRELEKLRDELEKTSSRVINFPRSQRTHKAPYVILIRNDRLFCLGADFFNSSPQVKVERNADLLQLELRNGVPLSTISSRNFKTYCPGFDPDRHFAWLKVAPASAASFVPLRRLLREQGFSVFFLYTDKVDLIQLATHADYSSTD